MIENVLGLEKVVIDPVKRCVILPTGVNGTQKVLKEEGEAKDHAMNQLKNRVPSKIEFHAYRKWQRLIYPESRGLCQISCSKLFVSYNANVILIFSTIERCYKKYIIV